MFRKTLIIILLGIVSWTSLAWANDCNDYIIPGRELMFDGTLSGLREAYQTFDDGVNDPNCSNNRELRFLHALTRTAMLVIRDDDGSIDSVLELGKQFSIDVLGDYWAPYFDPCGLELSAPSNQHDAYEIPDGAPDANEIRHIIDTNMIPEIEGIINDLNSISDSPGDRFRIFFDPNETRIFFDVNALGLETDVEVDYGEVLILKGLLASLKAQLQAQAAYDMCIDANDMLVEKFYGDTLSINDDLLAPHPNLLEVLPTPDHPDANGKALLAQARQGWVDAINYYLDVIDYISNEDIDGNDPQGDELLYIDPNDDYIVEEVNDRLTTLRDSLENDTIMTYAVETTKTYDIYDGNSAHIGQLVLVYNFTRIEGDDGSLTFTDSNLAPSPWEVDWFERVEANWIEIELEYYSESEWGQGWFEGTLSYDGNSITNGTFEYWGPADGNLTGLSGQLTSTEVEDANIDMNPIFGSSVRYPEPVNPRDLLPEFDEWNGPQPGTMGHGLGDDATLGGIIPDMNQYDWQLLGDALQPGGLFYLDFISPYQLIIDGNVDDWTYDQLVLVDISGDTEEDSNLVQGVDIKELYMAYDWKNVYGAITLYDNISIISGGLNWYELFLSYCPEDNSALDAIQLRIEVVANGSAYGYLYHMVSDDCGYTYWDYVNSFNVVAGPNAVEFKVPFIDIPAYLPGRFILLESGGWDPISYEWDGEWNGTHLKIGEVGTISGTVSYNGYRDAPIFVQAYTDPEDPDGSIVAGTMITEPGPYTLQGVGLGWRGYVRAFTPSFGFDNILWSDSFDIQDSMSVYLMGSSIDDIDLVLTNPPLLENGVWVDGQILPEKENQYYAFDAVQAGTYNIEFIEDIPYGKRLALFGRDGDEILVLDYDSGDGLAISGWLCPLSGRYYTKLQTLCETSQQTYQIRMTTDTICPQTDIACAEWVGVKDCKVDKYDLAVLVSNWLGDCSEPYWCDDSDFDESGFIDFADFAVLAGNWLESTTP